MRFIFNPTLIALIAILLALEISLRSLGIPNYLLPLPSEVATALIEFHRDLLIALKDTTLHVVVGLSFSVIGGLLTAMIISLSQWLRGAILPVALFFQMVPIIAIAPMLVIWFGYGAPSAMASSAIVSFFPVLASTLQGLDSAPPAMIELFRLYGASRFQLYLKLKFPNALPSIFNGIRISLGLAVVGSLVGEFIGGSGLGSLVDSARTQQRTDLVFAAVIASSFLGWALNFIWDQMRVGALKKWFFAIKNP